MKKLMIASLAALSLVCAQLYAKQHSTMTSDQKITYKDPYGIPVNEEDGVVKIRSGNIARKRFHVNNDTPYPVYVYISYNTCIGGGVCCFDSFHIGPKSSAQVKTPCNPKKITGYIYYSGDTPTNLVEWIGTADAGGGAVWTVVEKGARYGIPTIEFVRHDY